MLIWGNLLACLLDYCREKNSLKGSSSSTLKTADSLLLTSEVVVLNHVNVSGRVQTVMKITKGVHPPQQP